MKVAFTGTRNPPEGALTTIYEVIGGLDADTFISGAQHGVDTIAAVEAAMQRPLAKHILVIPNAPYNEQLEVEVRKLTANLTVLKMPHTGMNPYMARNEYMVKLCDELVAFPQTIIEERRSGTWATIRRAYKTGKVVSVYPLS